MILSLRQVKARIKSIEGTKKIMRAMEMVSASKLRRVQDTLLATRPYVAKLDSLLKNILASAAAQSETLSHPMLANKNLNNGKNKGYS